MAKYEWSEVFVSIEGEAKYSGHPTAYIRFTKCNFECRGFNNQEFLDTTSIKVLGFDPKDFHDIYSIPLITKGCDSIYSWDPKFAHMWKSGDETQLCNELAAVLPNQSLLNQTSKKRIIVSLTGGEPTLRIKFWIPLLDRLHALGMRHVLIETNCAVPLKPEHVNALYDWKSCVDTTVPVNERMKITWSNSPKLIGSGEDPKKAIRPTVAIAQMTWRNFQVYDLAPIIEQYFKFVCGPSDEEFEEVAAAMEQYYQAGIPRDVEVYIMPMACTEEQQQEISARVAGMCINRGFIYCHRIQNSVFGNGVGT